MEHSWLIIAKFMRVVEFYEELYRSEISYEQAHDDVFLQNLPQVSTEVNADLGKGLSLEELHKALQSMECGKAPRIDGLRVDFYKSFWLDIGTDLLAVLKDSLARGKLPLSCCRAVLNLLPRKKCLK